jgi:hypothetical protein
VQLVGPADVKGGSKLTDDTGKIIRGGERVSTTDGPYPESKEIVGGYFLLSARERRTAQCARAISSALQSSSG